MQKERKQALGYSLIILGIVVMFLKPITGVTGMAVASEAFSIVQDVWFWLFGLGMIILGIILQGGREQEGDLPRIIRSDRFERSIKRQPKDIIEKAIQKIGTGLANEEWLKHMHKYSIRASKGARILYDKRADGTVVLEEYLPAGEHY